MLCKKVAVNIYAKFKKYWLCSSPTITESDFENMVLKYSRLNFKLYFLNNIIIILSIVGPYEIR